MSRIAVVGAGPAGMTAAGFAARRGCGVTLIERNHRPGRKLMITGKGRCNVTNDCGRDEFLENVPVNGRFLFSALSAFGPAETMDFFEELQVPLKVERGRRVFPQSDRAVDIVDALQRFVSRSGCHMTEGRAAGLLLREGRVEGVRLEDGSIIAADAVIVCTGGLSYPLTGSTGDGYELAREAGHTVTAPKPSLVPLETAESWPAELQGLSLKNVTLEAVDTHGGAAVFHELGEMLFTHFGVSGPLVLSASSHMRSMEKGRYTLAIDMKPALDIQKLDQRLQRDIRAAAAKEAVSVIRALLPASMVPVFLRLTGIDASKKADQITREERLRIAAALKRLTLTVSGFRPIEEAIVTSGGVKVSEVDPKTMASKKCEGLYFAGEILDVDAHTGGYNLQIAFSTGHAAGCAVPCG